MKMKQEIKTVGDLEKRLSELSSGAGAMIMGGFLDPYWERGMHRLNAEFKEKYKSTDKTKKLDKDMKGMYEKFVEECGEPIGHIDGPATMSLDKRPIVVFITDNLFSQFNEINGELEKYELPKHMFLCYKAEMDDLMQREEYELKSTYSPILITDNNGEKQIKGHLQKTPIIAVEGTIDYKKLSEKLISVFFDEATEWDRKSHILVTDLRRRGYSEKEALKSVKRYALEKLYDSFERVFPKYRFSKGYPNVLVKLRRKYEMEIEKEK